ncbi:MAG TPA: TetR family transcriptional regulator [Methylophilaceae bacterium]|jgi:TetR/AcrR family acrAB operon transcriptional repressor
MVRRTKEDAEITRNLLLDAAETVFNEKGVSRTSLSEIAQAAGVTRGAIYWHFKNKADLFHAMLERVTMPIDEMIDQLDAEQLATPLICLKTGAVTVLKHIAADAQTRRVFDIVNHKCELVDDMAIARTRQLESRAGCLEHIEQRVQTAIDQDSLPKTLNARVAAIGMHALIDGLISSWILDTESFSLSKEADQLIEIYITGLSKA